ncbi:MAG: hypothetical protein LBC12_07565 [Nitrososphaerota archaeon]|nr:hypothetical protein [Nitrososphaerota archaeon]
MKTPMSQTRFSLGVVAVDGKVYAIGGFTNSGYLDLNEQYDLVTDTWTTLTSMPTPRNDFAIVACQGKIYCMGGITSNGNSWFKCGVNEVYDVVTDSWSTKASLPFNGSGVTAHAADGKIFVLNARTLYMYDPSADSWTEKTSMPTIIMSRLSFVLTTATGDKFMVIGEFQNARSSNAEAEPNL